MASTAWSHSIAIDQPKLHSPVKNDPAYSLLSPEFKWTYGTGSTPANVVYDIYLGTNAAQLRLIAENCIDGSFNDSCLIYTSQDTFNLFYINSLNRNTTYYWKVVARNNTGASTASEVWAFTTGSPNLYSPDPPNYISPVNNAINAAISPLFEWQASTDADGDKPVYDLYLSTSPSPATLVAANLLNPSFKLNTQLQDNTTYYWKVIARDRDAGGRETSSAIWKFTTQNTTQDTGATNLRVYYRYSDPVFLYKFEAAALNPAFTIATPAYTTRGRTTIKDAIAIVLDYTDPNTVVSFDLPTGFTSTSNIIYNNELPSGATKYFQIEGNFATHNTITVHLQNGPITRSYTIDAQINQKPTIPVLLEPANGAANVITQPEFKWSGGDDSDGNTLLYRLYTGTSANNLISAGLVANKKSIIPAIPLAGAQKYYWKISVMDADNETVESAVHSFVTQIMPLTAPSLQYPREISTYVETNVTLAWKYQDDPAISYDIYFDKNSTPQRIAQGVTGTTYTVQNLAPNTTYYWKVLAVDQQGATTSSKTGQFITRPANGNETGTFTDLRDGQIYQWVAINGRKWMTHNLAYRPQPKDGYYDYEVFSNGKSYVALNNNSQNISKYGYLYNWEGALNFDSETDTAANKQGVCPCGWHVPTNADWQSLAPLNTNTPVSLHYSNWTIPGKENDWLNTSGLSLLPSGYYSTLVLPAGFQTNAFQFWLAQTNRTTTSQAGYTWNTAQNKFIGNINNTAGYASVRCVKNATNNHAPGKPALQSPLNNSTHTNYSMLLQWVAATDTDGDAITYDLYADTLPDPAQLIKYGSTGTTYQLTELQQNKKYYWKVRARDPHGEVTESDVWIFTTQPNNNTPPAALQLQLPANGSTGVNPAAVNLTWTAATDAGGDAVTYNLYVGKQQATLQLIATNITSTAYTLNTINSSTKYFWKVVALDGRGGVTESSVNNFTTVNHAPTAPLLLTPANGMQGVKEQQLTWAPATDADGDPVYYRVLWGTDPAALYSSSEITGTSFNFGGTATLQNSLYYWQIIATDQKGGETASELRPFRTYKNELTNPGITPVTPVHLSTGVSLTPALSWTKPLPNVQYDVYVGLPGYSHFIQVAQELTDTPFVLNTLEGKPLRPHYAHRWKVVPKDATGNIYTSDEWVFTTRNSLPTKPVLTLPANGATNQPYSVTLTWTPANDADGDLLLYDIYSGANPNPTTLLAGDLQQNTYTASLQQPNTTYYWKVVVKDGFGGTIASDVYSFTLQNNTQNTAPEAPQLISPLAYESNINSPAILQWQAPFDIDGDALLYDVYVSTSKTFTTPVATGLSALQYITGALTHGVTYYWKIAARDGKGGETASPVWNFTAKNNAPAAPVLLTPAMNNVLSGATTQLTWSAAQDADNDAIVYDVYMDKNQQPVTLLARGVTTLSYNTPAIGNNEVYYWKVVARDALGSETSSMVFAFKGKNEAPSVPALQLPANNGHIAAATATLVWNASTDVDSEPIGYDVYFGASAASLQKTATVFTTSFTTGTLTVNTTYYWKVVATDKQQGASASAVWSFTYQPVVINQPPGMPQLIAPGNNSIDVSVQPTAFNWTAATDPENDPVKYDLYVSTNNQAATKIASDLSTTAYTLSNLANNTMYYWKVIAKDDHGNSTTSAISQFTTRALPTATNDPVLDEAITISPNPTSGRIMIILPELLHSWDIELYNSNGYNQYHRIVNGYVRKLELFIPGKGIYFIRLTNNKRTVVRKIVVL
ncbi:DUF2369 domain-containing protein [Niastella caeni]|uniref:DUF2369 domain-containing protein n=1 Tax=Niastella caeni TaxID=2569763 RepID=A0A4S8H9R3_9BACT|nr:fibronectin type III domain-containing protein [Niastella caeni]THU30789.1 DUF2369 domain-containing protein [Niastella caeni]